MMNTAMYTIDKICEKTGFSRRTVRYYVEIGLIEPPAGRGRGGFYNDSHLNTLLEAKRLQDKGIRLSTIMEYLKKGELAAKKSVVNDDAVISREVWVQYEIEPGVVLSVRRDKEEQDKKKISEIVRLAKKISQEGQKNE